jgi:transposase
MPMPFANRIVLDDEQRQKLEALKRAGSTPQALARRVEIVLRAAQPDNPSNLQIAVDLQCHNNTVGLWRRRFHELGLAGLQDAPRPGRPPGFSPR